MFVKPMWEPVQYMHLHGCTFQVLVMRFKQSLYFILCFASLWILSPAASNASSIIVIKPKYRFLAFAVIFISTDYGFDKDGLYSTPQRPTESILLPTPIVTTHHVSTPKSTSSCVQCYNWYLENVSVRNRNAHTIWRRNPNSKLPYKTMINY